jgi:hypothetical protein
MERKRTTKLKDLPPAEHAIGIYFGLLIGSLVLGIGAALLFRDLVFTFTGEGIKINEVILFKILLFFASSFASLACFFGLYRMMFLQRSQARKVDREFKDFTMYARPLVEEIIRQRVISENLSEKLDNISRRAGFGDKSVYDKGPPELRELAKRGEFLTSVAVLSSMSIGLFIYLERHPWELVPYSLIIMAVAWWYAVSRYFDLTYDIRSYYLPAMFIMLMPSLSIILRAYMRPYQVVYLVFAILFFYVWAMYTYFDYITGGKTPEIFSVASSKAMGFPPSRRLINAVESGDVSERINALFPQRKSGRGAREKNGDMPDRIKSLFPQRKIPAHDRGENGEVSGHIKSFFPEGRKGGFGKKAKNSEMPERINALFPPKKEGDGGPSKKTKNGDMTDKINDLFPPKK